MRTTAATLLLLSFYLGVPGVSLAEDDAEAIIDKALQAHGGLEKLTSHKAVQATAKGTMDVNGQDFPFTAETYAQFPNQFKTVIEVNVNGMKITQVQRMNKDKIEKQQ